MIHRLTVRFPAWQIRSGYLKARSYVVRYEYTRVREDCKRMSSLPKKDPDVGGYIERAQKHLMEAHGYLEGEAVPDMQAAADAITRADQTLVQIYGEPDLKARAEQLANELEARGLTKNADRLKQICRVVGSVGEADGAESKRRLYDGQAAATDAIGKIALCQQEEWINDDLQVARLSRLTLFVATTFVVILAASAIAANPHPVRGWPVNSLASLPGPLPSVLASLAVASVGAAGGLFSGLLITQEARASLLGYRTSVVRLTLKPMVGALMACVIYIILSWQGVAGITVTNGGTFLVIGFVTGFSERYILRVLNVPGASETAHSAGGEPETRSEV